MFKNAQSTQQYENISTYLEIALFTKVGIVSFQQFTFNKLFK